MIALRNLDLVLLAIALPVFLVAGWPIGGWITAAGIWAMWRGIGWYSDKKAAEATDPKRVVGIATGSMIGRGWLMALILVSLGSSRRTRWVCPPPCCPSSCSQPGSPRR